MRIPWSTLPLCALWLAACAHSSSTPPTTTAVPTPPSPPPADFQAQVMLGQSLYGSQCASCHGAAGEGGKAPRVVGLAAGALPLEPPPGAKERTMRFVTVADVADFVVKKMPADKPGALDPESYLAILAFDLKANGIDLGEEKLTMEKAAELTIPR